MGMVSYKHFYQLNKVIGFNKFYSQVSTIISKYQSAQKIIVINNFIMHRLFNPHAGVILDTFCYYTTNNWEKLIDQEDQENTVLIAIPILTTICKYIGLTKFLEKGPFEIKYNTDGTICEQCLGLD